MLYLGLILTYLAISRLFLHEICMAQVGRLRYKQMKVSNRITIHWIQILMDYLFLLSYKSPAAELTSENRFGLSGTFQRRSQVACHEKH